MCYICSCFAWTLDLIQRIITFCLACFLAFAVCCGIILAIAAGIAYGYNYSMAEFLTFTRSDVAVYMRRGQFHDSPDIPPKSLRVGDEENLAFSTITDYEEKQSPSPDFNVFSEMASVKDQDARKYAEQLTKYTSKSNVWSTHASEIPATPIDYQKPYSTHILTRISITPNPRFSTTVLRSGNSEIVMRNFEPIDIAVKSTIKTTEDYFYRAPDFDEKKKLNSITTTLEIPDINVRFENSSGRKTIPMRHWGNDAKPIVEDYPKDIDEDAVVYRP
ncbi:uncharacterized protein LOC131846841 [Achroia grisella]|uniref:uncharacterized protein LOC131846841 n=1 Tax=Achroia grisella TaxID=688607 RepID=UPI0027D2C801|nr:uncharacterized protein LOC131846841 [Achroia grisella]